MKLSKSLFIAAALTVLMVVAVQAAPLSGAIFTTTPNGGIVNENVHYNAKIEVYLDGGPGPNAPQTAAGLPDGDYVFQVTDPSGKVLLSEDASKCRVFRVADGVIVALRDLTLSNSGAVVSIVDHTNTDTCHVNNSPDGAAGTSGKHDTNIDLDHGLPAIVVQLMPFYNTPNPGGVYKAWVMPLTRYIENGGSLKATPKDYQVKGVKLGYQRDPGFGPSRDQVKTDNFKVKEFFPPEITVRKFHDLNGNGIWDAGEPEIGLDQCVDATGKIIACPGGWPYDFTEPVDGGTVTNTFYTPNTHLAAVAGTYTACEAHLTGWTQSATYVDGVKSDANQCASVYASGTTPGETHEIIFGNFMNATKGGVKFEDVNGNGTKDAGDNGLSGWTINLTGTDGMGNAVSKTTTTDVNGNYSFSVPPGTYKVCEVLKTGWTQTYPTGDGCHYVTLTSGQADTDNNFGNFKNVSVKACKVEDADGNLATTGDQTAIPGWTVYLSIDGVRQLPGQLTGDDGCYAWKDLGPGHSYDVEEDVPAGWTALTPITHDFGPATSGESYSFTFKNFENVEVTACKIKDTDGDLGTTNDQSYITGWTVYLSIDGVRQLPGKLTGDNGCYTWKDLGPGHSYDVEEDVPSGWIALTPTEHDFGPATSGATYSFTFINTPVQGCTPGFWQGGNDFETAGGKWLWNDLPDPEWPLSGGMGTNPYKWETQFNSFFTPYGALSSFDMMTLVGTGGGSDDFQKAARDLVAAYLNASWGMAYAYTTAELETMWTNTVNTGDFMTLHLLLDAANNAPGGCPISASGY
jgi:hypothetical protein